MTLRGPIMKSCRGVSPSKRKLLEQRRREPLPLMSRQTQAHSRMPPTPSAPSSCANQTPSLLLPSLLLLRRKTMTSTSLEAPMRRKARRRSGSRRRLKAYHEKKAKKPQVIAKTSVLLDVKPWDDETDHDRMLASVKSIEMDGLLWGAHKLIPIGYGIKKLQVMCTVEDEKVSVEELTEKIEEFEDFVQSCDVNAMNKI